MKTNRKYHVSINSEKDADRVNPLTGKRVGSIDLSNFILETINLAEQIITSNGYTLDIERVTMVCYDILSSSMPNNQFNRAFMESLYAGIQHKGYVPTQADVDKVTKELADQLGVPVSAMGTVLDRIYKDRGLK